MQGLIMKVFLRLCFPCDRKMLTLSIALEVWVSFHNVLSSSMQQTQTTEGAAALTTLFWCLGKHIPLFPLTTEINICIGIELRS